MNCINYVVREGDSLYRISRTFNVPLETILEANPEVDAFNLQVGEEICIPMLQYLDGYTTIIIDNERQLRDLLDQYGITMEDFMEFNGLDQFQPGLQLQVPMLDRFPFPWNN